MSIGRFVPIALLSIGVSLSSGCGANRTTIQALADDGSTKTISASWKTDLIYVATWCPYSKQLKQFLSDDRIKPYAKKRTLLFVFSKDEWPTVENHMKADAAVPESKYTLADVPDMMDALRVKSGNKRVMDPKFFKDLPGEHYFASLPESVTSFPKIASDGEWRETPQWVISTLEVPAELVLTVMAQYSPDHK